MIVRYSSNNSGGDWWLSEADWHNLSNAGWKVEFEKFLGAIARTATIEADSLEQAIDKWVDVVGLYPDAIGCPCCGRPHYFSVEED